MCPSAAGGTACIVDRAACSPVDASASTGWAWWPGRASARWRARAAHRRRPCHTLVAACTFFVSRSRRLLFASLFCCPGGLRRAGSESGALGEVAAELSVTSGGWAAVVVVKVMPAKVAVLKPHRRPSLSAARRPCLASSLEEELKNRYAEAARVAQRAVVQMRAREEARRPRNSSARNSSARAIDSAQFSLTPPRAPRRRARCLR